MPVLNDVAAVEANEVETQANCRIPEQCHCIDSVQGVRQTMDAGGGSKVIVPRTQGAQHFFVRPKLRLLGFLKAFFLSFPSPVNLQDLLLPVV